MDLTVAEHGHPNERDTTGETSAVRSRQPPWILDAAVAGLLTLLAALVYVWTKAPLYNPIGSIDPWLYTALWTNFDQIYHAFSTTYYASRVPWIAPGYVLNVLAGPIPAYFLMHVIFFLGGGLLFYVACRRAFGRAAAACGYIALIGSQMYFNAHRWDYEEGGVITFLIAALAFALSTATTARRRFLSFVLCGFFAAAVVGTRITDTVYLVGIAGVYAAFEWRAGVGLRVRQVAEDVAGVVAGAVALVLVCGAFARAYGGEFFFFMPQIRVTLAASGSDAQLPVDLWFPIQSYFFVPVFIVVFAVLMLLLYREPSRARRVLIAATAWLATVYLGLVLWEFLGTGWIFDLGYYFSSFVPLIAFCLAGCVGLYVENERKLPVAVVVPVGVAAAVLVPVLWVYRDDLGTRSANGLLRGPYLATWTAFGAALLLFFARPVLRLRVFTAAAVVAAFFAVSFGIDASNGTYADGASDARTGDAYSLGTKLITYLRHNGFKTEMPRFWYDGAGAQGPAYGSLQSLYYLSFTYVGIGMPNVDDDFKSRMAIFHPQKLVLLCSDASCSGAAGALERNGYPGRELRRRLLEAGELRVWVVVRSIEP